MIISKGWTGADFKLVHKDGTPAEVGDEVVDFRGADAILKGGAAPHKSSSQGKVYVDTGQFYPSVFGLRWTAV